MRTAPFETAALTAPIERESLIAYRADLPSPHRRSRAWLVAGAAGATASFVFLLGFWVWVIGPDQFTDPDLSLWLLVGVGGAIYTAIPVLIIRSLVRDWSGAGGRRPYRLDRFARANGLRYALAGSAATPAFPGLVFASNLSPTAGDLLSDDSSGFVVGDVGFTTGSGRSARQHRWGFASIRLGLRLPHLVLDARGNNSLIGRTNLPGDLDPRQRLSLEGDFDRHFTMYCPRGYERDALYLFSPDIMERFIDRAAQFDVEVVDDRLFLYSPRSLATLDPETWEWVRETLVALEDKVARWDRWRDGRLGETRVERGRIVRPPHGVSRAGRRLTSRIAWWQVALGFVALVIGLVALVNDLFSLFD